MGYVGCILTNRITGVIKFNSLNACHDSAQNTKAYTLKVACCKTTVFLLLCVVWQPLTGGKDLFKMLGN